MSVTRVKEGSLIELCCKNLITHDRDKKAYEDDKIPQLIKNYIFYFSGWCCQEDMVNQECRKKFTFLKSSCDFTPKIYKIEIDLFNYNGYKRIEFSIHTYNIDVYFKIIGKAQAQNTERYLFNSIYKPFPVDQKGMCTVEAVEVLRSRLPFFALHYLNCPLVYFSYAQTTKRLYQKIDNTFSILQHADESVERIKNFLNLIIKQGKYE